MEEHAQPLPQVDAVEHQDRRRSHQGVPSDKDIKEKIVREQLRRKAAEVTSQLAHWSPHVPLLTRIALAAYLIILVGQPTPVQGQHVVFEDIGHFAGATSYIHVSFHLDLGDLLRPILTFKDYIKKAKANINTVSMIDHSVNGEQAHGVLLDLLIKHKTAHQIILDQAEVTALNLEADFLRLKSLFPVISHQLPAELRERNKRFLGPIGAVLGTFLGIFSQTQIKALERQIGDLYSRTQNLIDITSKHTQQINEHTNLITDLTLYLNVLTVQNPAITLQDVYTMERNITRALEIARNTFQTAQFRRLSIDFLTAEHLQIVFKTIQTRAAEAQATLIPERASDLFQLEMSYIFNGEQAIFILHVPTIPHGALLRLLRFHSFPLVYQDTAFLPKPENDVIALSSDFGELSLELNYADLMDCQHNNRFYVCEKHGILKRRFDSTCLGALHHQNWVLAISLCQMEVGHTEEAVLHLQGSKYLVYSPVDVTAPIQCGNTSDSKSTQAYIAAGIREITVQPGCTAQLTDHQIISDSSIQLDTDIAHFAWNFSSLSSEITPLEIKLALQDTTHNLRFSRLTLSDLMQNVREHREAEERAEHESQHRTFYTIMIVAIVLASIAFLYGLVATSTGAYIRRSIYNRLNLYHHAAQQRQSAQPPEDVENALS
jgi:hypothetical protein